MPPGVDAVIRAAGAVLWRAPGNADAPEVGLVHRPRYDDWSLPKGKLDDGECPPQAAVREVAEETGHKVALGRRLGRAHYVVRSPKARQTGPKIVDYWAARAVDGTFAPNHEVDELRWLSPAAARDLLSYDFDRTVLDSFVAVPLPTATVLLVRHGEAGERAEWDGDDYLRPLTEDGLRQAAELCSLLALFVPSAVHSAPPVRCVQTVEPLAAALGVEVVLEPLLSEDGYTFDPDAARRRFLELARGTVVVCSQGGVIPDLVFALAGPAALDADGHGDIPSRKGSTWVLSMRDTQCLTADHYPPKT
jgi:8-oxo-dGTP diphosphatase